MLFYRRSSSDGVEFESLGSCSSGVSEVHSSSTERIRSEPDSSLSESSSSVDTLSDRAVATKDGDNPCSNTNSSSRVHQFTEL